MKVLSKEYSLCKAARRHNKPVGKHKCQKNYSGSSKSMEIQATLKMKMEAWESESHASGTIVSDNDTTMKS